VGIFGSPNAGKSTLITAISSATPKVADYPFTTLVPNLGVVSHKDFAPFVVADVPGLISGASEGKGLGHDFLRHIERTKMLVHLVDGSISSFEAMKQDYEGILEELRLYDENLLNRPRLTVISKMDIVQDNEGYDDQVNQQAVVEEFRVYLKSKGVPWLEISSALRLGITQLLDSMIEKLSTAGWGN
jgi:GTPase